MDRRSSWRYPKRLLRSLARRVDVGLAWLERPDDPEFVRCSRPRSAGHEVDEWRCQEYRCFACGVGEHNANPGDCESQNERLVGMFEILGGGDGRTVGEQGHCDLGGTAAALGGVGLRQPDGGNCHRGDPFEPGLRVVVRALASPAPLARSAPGDVSLGRADLDHGLYPMDGPPVVLCAGCEQIHGALQLASCPPPLPGGANAQMVKATAHAQSLSGHRLRRRLVGGRRRGG